MRWSNRVDELIERAQNNSDEVERSVRELVEMFGEPFAYNEVTTEKILAGLEKVAESQPEETILTLSSIISREEYRSIDSERNPEKILEFLTALIVGIVSEYPEASRHESVERSLQSISTHRNPLVRYYSELALYGLEHPPDTKPTRRLGFPVALSLSTNGQLDQALFEIDELKSQQRTSSNKIEHIERNLRDLNEEMNDIHESLDTIKYEAREEAYERVESLVEEQMRQVAREEVSETARSTATESVEDIVDKRVDDRTSELDERFSNYIMSDDFQTLYTPIIKTVTGTGAIVGAVMIVVAVLVGSIPLIGAFSLTTLFLIYAFRYSQQRGVPQ